MHRNGFAHPRAVVNNNGGNNGVNNGVNNGINGINGNYVNNSNHNQHHFHPHMRLQPQNGYHFLNPPQPIYLNLNPHHQLLHQHQHQHHHHHSHRRRTVSSGEAENGQIREGASHRLNGGHNNKQQQLNNDKIGEDTLKQKTVDKLTLTLNQYRKSGKLCDFELTVGEKVFPVHKVVLAASSGYFVAMFNNKDNFIENEKNSIDLSAEFDDPETCETMLSYIYTGVIAVNAANVQDIARFSNLFELLELLDYCSTYLVGSLCKDNCIGILRFSDFYGFPQLYYTTKRYVEYHFAEVSREEEFLELTPKLMRQFLRSESLSIDHESQVLVGTLNWIAKDQGERLPFLEEFINLVRMPLISPEQLRRIIARYQAVPAIIEVLTPYLSQQKQPKQSVNSSKQLLPSSSSAAEPKTSTSGELMDSEAKETEETEEADTATASYSLIRQQARMCSRRRVYVLGGLRTDPRQTSTTLNSMLKFDLHTGVWEFGAAFGYQRSSHCAVKFHGQIFLIGGECDSLILDTVQAFDPETAHLGEANWREVGRLKTPRSAFGAVVYEDSILVFGGKGHCSGATIERYDPVLKEWNIVGSMPQSLHGMQALECDGLVYIIGGRSPALGHRCLDTLFCYDPESGEFKELAPMNSPRSDFGAAVLHGHIYVFGGLDSYCDPLITVEQYNITENKWSFLSPLKSRRASMSAAAINNLIYIFGGRQVNAPFYLRDVSIYDPSLDQWLASTKPMPHNRTDAAVVVI